MYKTLNTYDSKFSKHSSSRYIFSVSKLVVCCSNSNSKTSQTFSGNATIYINAASCQNLINVDTKGKKTINCTFRGEGTKLFFVYRTMSNTSGKFVINCLKIKEVYGRFMDTWMDNEI